MTNKIDTKINEAMAADDAERELVQTIRSKAATEGDFAIAWSILQLTEAIDMLITTVQEGQPNGS